MVRILPTKQNLMSSNLLPWQMIELHRALVVHNGNVANSEATGDHVCKYKEMT